MHTSSAAELLARVPIFRGVGEELLEVIEYVSAERRYKAGMPVVEKGTPAEGATLIVNGTAAQFDAGGETIRHQFGRGWLLSQMAMFVRIDPVATVLALEDVEALHIPREVMHQVILEQPGLAELFAYNIRRNLGHLTEVLKEMGEGDTVPPETFDPASTFNGNGAEDRIPPEPERDPMVSPSPGLHPQPEGQQLFG